jgi:dual specificity protein kinase YAK1
MLDMGKQTSQFFDSYVDTYGRKRYQLKSLEKYSREHNTNEQPGKKYFTHSTLPEIIKAAPIPAQRAKPQEAEKGMYNGMRSPQALKKITDGHGQSNTVDSPSLTLCKGC